MDFVTAQTLVAERCGLDLTVTDQATRIKRWINLIQQTVSAWRDWSWLESREIIEAVPDITTGTVTTTQNSTGITFSSAPAASVAGYFFQTSEADDWYKISTHTAAQTAATLETQYTRTGGAGLSYTLRKVYYSTTLDRIFSIRQGVSPSAMEERPVRRFDHGNPNPTDTGEPKRYLLWGLDSSGYWQFTPDPIPDERLLMELRGYLKLTDLSANADVSKIPVKWHQILVDGAVWVGGAAYVGDRDMQNDSKKNVADLLEQMVSEDGQGTNEPSVRRSIDDSFADLPEPRLPDNYDSRNG